MWLSRAAALPPLQALVTRVLASPPLTKMIFILDPSSLPEIVSLCQVYGMAILEIVFYMTRTYAYGLHRKKLILLGKWPYAKKPKEKTNPQNVAGTIARRPDVPNVPHLHATRPEPQIVSQVPSANPASQVTANQNSLCTQYQTCAGRGVASMHHLHHTHVIPHQARDIVASSERCADGEGVRESSETYGMAADRLVTPTTL